MSETMQNMNVKEELDYKEAYTFLFNSISDMIEMQLKMAKQMLISQKQCEELCIGNQPENLNADSKQILEILVDMIKKSAEQ